MIKQYDIVIFLGGDINFTNKEIESITENKIVIFADRNNYSANITANLVMGDFDSINKSNNIDNSNFIIDHTVDSNNNYTLQNNLKEQIINNEKTTYIHAPDQNYTDFEKILYLIHINQIGKNLMILGIYGGEMDHSLWNNLLIKKYSDKFFIQFLHKSAQNPNKQDNNPPTKSIDYGFVLNKFNQDEYSITSNRNINYIDHIKHTNNISIISFGDSFVLAKSLAWPLNNFNLSKNNCSVRNKIINNEANVKLLSGDPITVIIN